MFVIANIRVPDFEPQGVPMDRAVTRSGKDADGDIIRLCNPSASWPPVSKATAIRHIDAKTHTYHVPWRTGRTEIRVVQGQHGRY